MSVDLTSLQQRAGTGDARAQAEYGARLIVGKDAPLAPQEGRRLLDAALKAEDAYALQFEAVLAALGYGRKQDWTAAYALVRRAAALGDAAAQGQMSLLGDPFDPAAWVTPPPAYVAFQSPRVATSGGFIPSPVCNWLIAKARSRLRTAEVKNPHHGGVDAKAEYRSNSAAALSVIDTDLVTQLVHARIVAATGIPVARHEPTNILHYATGERYQPHFDYLDPKVEQFQAELARFGQRIATFLIYLNDDYEAGDTAFPRLDWRLKGRTGDALFFWNVDPDGQPDPRTLHAGLPPTQGEKWLFSKWMRDRPLPLA